MRSGRALFPSPLNEDAGAFTKKKSSNVLSFSSMFGRGGEKLCQWVIASWIKDKDNKPTQADLEAIWHPILADVQELAVTGVGPWRCFLLFAKADLEARTVGWGLPLYNGPEPCTECRSNRTNLPYTDVRADSLWRATEISRTADWIARARIPLHPLLSSSFLWRGFLPLDLMHLLDCNGVANIVGGSIIRGLY